MDFYNTLKRGKGNLITKTHIWYDPIFKKYHFVPKYIEEAWVVVVT